ncbi:heterogeneous nuclear ribonucleoprotein A0-like [Harmonia axyridis]|uniref:heterogeneous nuclear ribonucleoprotein A0-like n=1 Tax=Harmonia axyridis TaxID=115357 RepID=UPI001E277CE5|nr:heterogeneous nuclear ribonucleoprotein A0-like [Harmonia axyridis]
MFCDTCKSAVVLVAVFFTIAEGRPGFYDSHGLSPGSYSGGGGNGYEGLSQSGGLGNYGNDNGLESHEGGSSDGGDYHHGVSVVALGNQKGPTFDLTKHGAAEGHRGLYGGSFVAGKYEGSSNEGHQGGYGGPGSHYTAIAGYGDSDEHTALLAASLSSGHSGFEGSYAH